MISIGIHVIIRQWWQPCSRLPYEFSRDNITASNGPSLGLSWSNLVMHSVAFPCDSYLSYFSIFWSIYINTTHRCCILCCLKELSREWCLCLFILVPGPTPILSQWLGCFIFVPVCRLDMLSHLAMYKRTGCKKKMPGEYCTTNSTVVTHFKLSSVLDVTQSWGQPCTSTRVLYYAPCQVIFSNEWRTETFSANQIFTNVSTPHCCLNSKKG